MFCPKCATQNVDGASFCRACGANIGLVPQALNGQLQNVPPPLDKYDRIWGRKNADVFRSRALARAERRARKRARDEDVPPSMEKGIVNLFMGIGFIIAALAVMFRFPGGFAWGWAFFFPGFSCLGKGIASIVAANRSKPAALPPSSFDGPATFPPGVPQSLAVDR